MRMATGFLSLWLLAACSPPEQAPPTTPPPPATTAMASAAPTASATPPPAETAAPTASATASVAAKPPPPPPVTYPAPTYPKKAKTMLPKHGQEAWAIYLAAAETSSPEFNAASSAWIKTGLAVAVGEVDCDEGAKDKVKGKLVVRTYVRTEAEAKAFVKETKPEPAGIAKVKVMCAD